MKLDKYTVGKRYGKALFELANEKGQTEAIYQELLILREVFHQVPGIGEILSDVRLEPYEKDVIMEKLVSGFDSLMKNFLAVVYNYGRMNDMLLMIDEYEHRYNENNGLLLGSVTTAVPLSAEQLTRLEENVAKTMNYQTVELKQQVDSTIIGGAIVEADHQVIDGSIRTQLEKLRNQLNR